jgi:hypothetical protein
MRGGGPEGGIDILFANAGSYETGTMGDISETYFDKIFSVLSEGCSLPSRRRCPLIVDVGTGRRDVHRTQPTMQARPPSGR